MTEPQHVKLAPSGAHRWMNCPGSVRLSAGLPDKGSEHAAYGTFAHYVAAHCLRKGRSASDQVGKTCANFGASEEDIADFIRLLPPAKRVVTHEMAVELQLYLDAVTWIKENESAMLLVEHRVYLFDPAHPIPDDCPVWGTADALLVPEKTKGATRLDIVDLKFGAGTWVSVEGNEQQMIYALATLHTLDKLLANVKTIGLHIVQPRHFSKSSRWRTVDMTRADLEQWGATKLQTSIEQAQDPNAPCIPGDWCHWCLAFDTCEAVRTHATETAVQVFGETPELLKIEAPIDPAKMTGRMAAQVLTTIPLVEKWFKSRAAAVYQRAYDLVKGGEEVPGFKIIRKLGNRVWASETEAQAMLIEHGVEPFKKPQVISPTQAEKELGPRRKRAVKGLTVRPDNGTALVPVKDKRSAISPGDVFDDLTQPKE